MRLLQSTTWKNILRGKLIEVTRLLFTTLIDLRTVEWMFVRGIRSQLDSLRQGFNSVFSMDKLGSFTPGEVFKLCHMTTG